MLVPLSWLRTFTPADRSAAQLSDAFNELGLVVEGVEVTGEGLDGVVTALVRGIRKHPNADRMRLIDIVLSEDQVEPLQVACGAFNFVEGDRVPLAQVGAVLPGNFKIERAKKRGEWSNGMLCSARELRLSDDHEGILVLSPDTPLNVPIAEALGMMRDTVFDLSIEANRPDAMSIAGIARDLAAKLGDPFTMPTDTSLVTSASPASSTPGSITATDLCDRLTVTVIRGVVVGPSTPVVRARLAAAGMRSVSNVVDASNYVMLELGAPSHTFDLDKLPGGRIGVRWAATGEKLTTLDEVERTLASGDAQDGVIVDGADAVVGIAAVMGGASSEVDEHTTSLLLEVAHWTPMCIARTSKRMGLRSEASARFERGTDPELLPRAAARVVEILRETSPGVTVESYDDLRPVTAAPKVVRVRAARVNRILGTDLTNDAIPALIAPIGFICTSTDVPGEWDVTIPSWRPDSTAEIDVVEEVGRMFGYDNIERRTLRTDLVGVLTADQRDARRVGAKLAATGAEEVWTATLISPADLERCGLPADAVSVANPMVQEESVLRPSLLPGMLRALGYNASHRNPAIRLFEIGHVFGLPRPEQVVPYERTHLAAVFAADGDDARTPVEVLDQLVALLRVNPAAIELRAVSNLAGLHPTRSAQIIGSGTGFPIGTIGEVDPGVAEAWSVDRRVGWLQVDLENLCHLPRRPIAVESFSRFPSSDADLAFVVPVATPAATIEAALRRAGGALLLGIELFDVYRGDRVAAGSRSLAYRLRLGSADHTLSDVELAEIRQRLIDAATNASPGVALRS